MYRSKGKSIRHNTLWYIVHSLILAGVGYGSTTPRVLLSPFARTGGTSCQGQARVEPDDANL